MPVLDNPRHEAICRALAAGKGITESYASGGFRPTPASASKFAKRPEIQARVRELLEATAEIDHQATKIAVKKLSLDKEWVIQRLMWLAERSLRGAPLLDERGVQIPGKFTGRPQGQVAARALELLGQTLGIFIQRQEIGGPGDFARLTDAELETKIREDAAALGLSEAAIRQMLANHGLPETMQ